MKKVSIIVPIYNSQDTLVKCIESIISQTYKNIELILINDGSDDNSEQICSDYLKRDNRIIYKYQKNSGPSRSRNLGIQISKGYYITFIDSDDFVNDSYIENLVKQLVITKSDICISGYNQIYSSRTIPKIPIDKVYDKIEEGVFYLFHENLLGLNCGKLFKKSIVIENQIRFRESTDLFEDQYFFCDFYKNCKRICVIEQTDYNYIMMPNSLCNKPRKDLFWKYNAMFEFLKIFFDEIKMNKENINYLLGMYSINIFHECFENNIRNDLSYNKIKKELKEWEKTGIYMYICDNFHITHKSIKKYILYIGLKYKQYFILLLIYRIKYLIRRIK